MKKLVLLLTLITLALPLSAVAQADDAAEPRPDREPLRERPDRPNDRDNADRDRDHDRDKDKDRDRSRHRETLPVEMIDQAIETLRAMHPDDHLGWLDEIQTIAKDKPEEAARRLSRYPRLMEMIDARQNRPAEFELHIKHAKLMREVFVRIRKVRQAQQENNQATIDELRPEIRERIEALFQVRLKFKELEIQRIREQLQQAEQELKDIENDSNKLIDQKLQELMDRSGKPRGPRGDRPERRDNDNDNDR